MKTKRIISAIAACILLTGCAQNGNSKIKSPKIDYSDMFKQKSDENTTFSKKNTETKAASPTVENDVSAEKTDEDDNDDTQSGAVNENQTIHKSYAANGAVNEIGRSNNETSETDQKASSSLTPQVENNVQSSENTNTSNKTIGNRKPSSVIYTSDQAVANLQFGDICYFPYRNTPKSTTPNENVVRSKEPATTTNKDDNILKFTAGISSDTANEINKLNDEQVKEIQDVIGNIAAEANGDAGFDTKTKLYVTPNTQTQQTNDIKSLFLDLSFTNENNEKIQPQDKVTVQIPVPSSLKSSTDVFVYRIRGNNIPTKIKVETQTINGTEYIVFETDNFGAFALTNAEIKQSDVDKLTSKEKIYDHGYKVVFRTETDTYLLGTFPYGSCKWEETNDMCREIECLFDTDCQMVGIPSLEDLKYFTECGIYLPGQYEMWTSTSASPNSAYYRNEKGAFYSTKSKSKKCGVCAIIRISASQNAPDLLSSSLSNYEETKARLKAEEEQYKLSISE